MVTWQIMTWQIVTWRIMTWQIVPWQIVLWQIVTWQITAWRTVTRCLIPWQSHDRLWLCYAYLAIRPDVVTDCALVHFIFVTTAGTDRLDKDLTIGQMQGENCAGWFNWPSHALGSVGMTLYVMAICNVEWCCVCRVEHHLVDNLTSRLLKNEDRRL